jgi:uncharacterized membrane protein YdjX (TVP38/TMEM64 family)
MIAAPTYPVWPSRRMLVMLALFAGMVVWVQAGQHIDGLAWLQWLGGGQAGPLLLLVFLAGFIVLSFATVPQFLLIGASVITFGPWAGFALAWCATMVSAWLGYLAGPKVGAWLLPNRPNAVLHSIKTFLVKNGFWSALWVRFIPSGPFVLVNLAFGASKTRLLPFLAGTGIGIIPKAVLIALTGQGLVQAVHGQNSAVLLLLAIIGLILAGLGIFRQRMLPGLIKQGEIAPASLE